MSDVHEQTSLSDPIPSVSSSAMEGEHPIRTPTSVNKNDDDNENEPSHDELEQTIVVHSDTESESDEAGDPDIEPLMPSACEAHETQIRALQLRLAQLEDKLAQITQNDARRDAEIVLLKADNEARLRALENRISEIHSRVLVMQEGLVRSGTIQRRQRA